MTGFRIRNASDVNNLRVFVSKYSNINNGSDEWYNVATNFDDPSKSSWSRSSWEVIVFNIPGTSTRRGWYIDPKNGTVDITFYGFDQDIGLVRN